MKILVAPDSFKNSLSSYEICQIFKNNCINEVICCPMADGGEGTVNALVSAKNGEYININVCGPNYIKVKSTYGIINNNTAVIEMSSCSGLYLAKNKNPYYTTTYGLGEILKDCLNRGIKNFVIGLGGSATNDLGIGMLRALGMKFFDKNSNLVIHAKDIYKIQKIDKSDFDKRIETCKFLVACDVDNPLTGINGASYVYAPQKGAKKHMVKHLDFCFKHFEKVLEKNLEFKGAGAAGGLGACFKTFFNAKLEKGVKIVSNLVNLEDKIKECDIVITGEGRSDQQTKFGKTPYGVLMLAKKHSKKTYLFSGKICDKEELLKLGFDKLVQISPDNVNIRYAIINTKKFLIKSIKNIGL